MSIRFAHTAIAAILALVFQPSFASSEEEVSVVVSATRIPYRDVEATYASEIHTRSMIERSGASSLVDYLGQHTSLTVMPSYGNRFTPTIEMRGYGLESGNQNVVISIDGQRLNSVDTQPQLLGAIPLVTIDRIEITKGSGSVLQGDGAMAGAIRIFTRPLQGVAVEVRAGNHGLATVSAGAGLSSDVFSLSVSADHDRHGGYAESDRSGKKDASALRAERAQIRLQPAQNLQLSLDFSSALADTRYQNPLTLAQFNASPAQNGGANIYTNYVTEISRWRVGAAYDISSALKMTVDHHRLDQQNRSTAWWGGFSAGYDTEGDDVALIYTGEVFDLTAGFQRVDASRTQTTNRTSKDNSGRYVQASYRLGSTTISAGARDEEVRYSYKPTAGAAVNGEHRLNGWDIGLNQRLDAKYTVFANLNKSFQAPDVDRFFNFGGAFNGFIVPAEAKTLTAGVNRVAGYGNRFKLAIFRTQLTNEIFYDPLSTNNTNIDKSSKYGVEVQQHWKPISDLSLNAVYSWTKTKIDSENSAAGAYNGKEIPGVPRHSVNLAATYAIDGRTEITASHAWRSKSFAISDFDNNNAQRQAAFEATNLSFKHKRDLIVYVVTINNLLGRKNGLWGGDNTIYPINFSRSIIAGINAKF